MFLEESESGQLGEGQLGGPGATPSGRHAHPRRPQGGELALLGQRPIFPKSPRNTTLAGQTREKYTVLFFFFIYLLFHASKGNSVVIKVIQFAAPGRFELFSFAF